MAATPSSQPEVLYDSLPYVEAVHEDYEEYALALFEEEMKQIQPRPLKKKMRTLRYRTPIMKQEYATLVVDGEFKVRPETRYQPLKIARPSSLDEWKTIAIPQAKTLFESERIRSLVLEAEKEETVANWKDYNSLMDQLQSQWTTALEQQREEVQEINFQRQQTQQQQLGPQLDQLNLDYQQMLYRRNQLEHAIEGLRREMGSVDGAGATESSPAE
jgi:hypothetical protein